VQIEPPQPAIKRVVSQPVEIGPLGRTTLISRWIRPATSECFELITTNPKLAVINRWQARSPEGYGFFKEIVASTFGLACPEFETFRPRSLSSKEKSGLPAEVFPETGSTS
jgi:hypothetical protein